MVALLVWPYLHLEITSVGREQSQTYSNLARKAPSDVNMLWSNFAQHQWRGLVAVICVTAWPEPFHVCPHTFSWCVGIKLMQLLVAGLDVTLLLAILLSILWDSKHKVKASSCRQKTGTARLSCHFK